jgi:hypothetical protein
MRRIRLRIALPALHALIDLVLLLASVYHQYLYAREAHSPFQWIDDRREYPSVAFEYYVPRPLGAVSNGTLPVSYVADRLFPTWLGVHPFNLSWAGFHLAVGVAFWYAVGRFSERSQSWRIALISYLAFRAATLPLALSPGPSRGVLDGIYIVVWFGAVVLGLGTVIGSIARIGYALLSGRRGRA